jgi:hypothetical protein
VVFCGKRLAFYPLAWVAVFGTAITQLHQAAQPRLLHCAGCGHRFSWRSGVARFAWVIFITLLVLLVLNVFVFVLTVFAGIRR